MKKPSELLRLHLKDLLDRSDISQAELARRLEVPASVISRWIAGDVTPTVDTIESIAGVFGLTASQILATETTPPKISKPSPKDALAILKDRLDRLEERDEWFMKALTIAEESHWDSTGPTYEVMAKIYNVLMEFMAWPERAKEKPDTQTELDVLLQSFDKSELKMLLEGAKAIAKRKQSKKQTG